MLPGYAASLQQALVVAGATRGRIAVTVRSVDCGPSADSLAPTLTRTLTREQPVWVGFFGESNNRERNVEGTRYTHLLDQSDQYHTNRDDLRHLVMNAGAHLLAVNERER